MGLLSTHFYLSYAPTVCCVCKFWASRHLINKVTKLATNPTKSIFSFLAYIVTLVHMIIVCPLLFEYIYFILNYYDKVCPISHLKFASH